MQHKLLSDEQLVSLYRAETDAVARERCANELFGRHYARVGCWCLRLVGERERAADLAQEVFLKAYQHLHSFAGESRFSTWLYAIARNHCWNEIRSRSLRPEFTSDDGLLDAVDAGETPYVLLERKRSISLARELVQTALDEIEQRVVTLHYVEELPLDAITRLLGLENASGAKAYIVSARRKLSRAAQRWRARERLAS